MKNNVCAKKISSVFVLLSLFLSGLLTSCQEDSVMGDIVPERDVKIERTKEVVSICYVEVNDNNILNVGSYTLKESGKPFFNLAMIFAANINYDASTGHAVLYFNPNVQHILSNTDKYIKSLKAKGIKVVLSVLGNHDGIGFANLSPENISDFVCQCRATVDKYGLDGLDFDDEWSEYGKVSGLPTPSSAIYGRFLIALREAMPDKLITLYSIGYSNGFNSSIDGIDMGTVVDYSYNAYYGSYSGNSIKGLDLGKWGAAPIGFHQGWFGPTPSDPSYNMNRLLSDGYGVNLCYDMRAQDYSSYLSKISTILYGEETVLSGEIYTKDW